MLSPHPPLRLGSAERDCLDEGKAKAKMHVAVVAINNRNLEHWMPLIDRLNALGHRTSFIFFPNTLDDDHKELLRSPLRPIYSRLLGEGKRPVDRSPAQLKNDVLEVVSEAAVDAVLITSHNGPGKLFKSFFEGVETRPVMIGCQQGVHQPWSAYAAQFTYDYFFVWGDRYRQLFPAVELRSRIITSGLPKLDLYEGVDFSGSPKILFFAKAPSAEDAAIARLLEGAERTFGARVVIKPHPRFVDAFASFSDRFEIVAPNADLKALFAGARLVLTPGSTTFAEALVLGIPAVLLPGERSRPYAEFELTLSELALESLVQIVGSDLERYPWGHVRRILPEYVVDAGRGQTDRAYGALESVCRH